MKNSFKSIAALAGAAMMVATVPASAQDALPAVSEYNWKLNAGGGMFNDDPLYYFQGSVSTPLTFSTGLQIDGIGGLVDGDGFGGVGAHLFWRDPSFAMAGIYGSYFANTYGANYDVVNAGVEGELYFGMFSVEGLVGAQFVDGDDADILGELKLAVYPIDDLRVYGGYRYWFGENEGAAGLEWQFPGQNDNSINWGLFADGRFMEDNTAVMGGVKVYFGSQKSLIRRHREDDPQTKQLPDLRYIAPAVAGCPAGFIPRRTEERTVRAVVAVESPWPAGCVPDWYYEEYALD